MALLNELAIIAALGVLVAVLVAKLRLPTVAGLLLAGALGGPHGLGMISSIEAIEDLADMGVVLLLFTIGLEFSLTRLRNIFRQVALGGLLQVSLTVSAAAGLAMVAGLSFNTALFYGFVFSLSSTAIVLRALSDRRELDAPHGRFIVGTLIFQDLCVVPMVLIVPELGPGRNAASAMGTIGSALAQAALVVFLLVVAARLVVPRLLAWVDASRSREVFLLAVLALCIGTAWLTSLVGLSLALGAFLGGMVVADTEYGHRAMGDVLPLRDAFVSIFFVSLGMLFDINVVLQQPGLVALLLVGFIFGKGFLAAISAQAAQFSARVAFVAGLGLGQFGEFGFVLAKLGLAHGVVDSAALQPLMAAGIMSMFLTPVVSRLAPYCGPLIQLLRPLERLLGSSQSAPVENDDVAPLNDHVVLVGYGVGGKLASQALARNGFQYVVLDMNAENVRQARAQGVPIFYGDATSEEALMHARLPQARVLVLLTNDAQGATRVVDTARRVAPKAAVLMRTHYLGECAELIKVGATDVVAEEVEAALEVLARLLRWCDVPRNLIDRALRQSREQTQTTQRPMVFPRRTLNQHEGLADLKIESYSLDADSQAIGRSVANLDLRQQSKALVVAVRRDGQLLEQPDPGTPFEIGDVVYLVGRQGAIDRAMELLGRSPSSAHAEPDEA
jgi:CPA2 family monovalent cation:H+ antiporter-2